MLTFSLCGLYKAKLANQLRAAGLYDLVPAETWAKNFNVSGKANKEIELRLEDSRSQILIGSPPIS